MSRKDINNEEIKRLYLEEKKGSSYIAKIMNCDHSTILDRLRKMGIIGINILLEMI